MDDKVDTELAARTARRYQDGDDAPGPLDEQIFIADYSHKCPVYVHRTPPCQGSCPAGEDIRGWLQIVRGIEKSGAESDDDSDWQEYAFRRLTASNPFPAIMGRVCPAPCEDGCNRNEVEEQVGINAVEHFIGDSGIERGFGLGEAGADTGKKVAIIGGGPAGLAAAYQLRRRGHGCTVFDDHADLGGMMRYGIPGYRTPRDVIDAEIKRITDMGVEIRLQTRVGVDVTLETIENDYDAILVAIGAQAGTALPVPGGEAPNVISGISFLAAFNENRLMHAAQRVMVIGGGDTAMDVAAVARRIGHIENVAEKDRVEHVIMGHTAHDVATVAKRQGAEVTIVYRRPIERAPAAKMEIEHVRQEGVEIRTCLAPVEAVLGPDGRATALRVIEVEWEDNKKMTAKEGSEFDIPCDLIVPALGQVGDFRGMEGLANERGLVDADKNFQVPDKPGYFVAGDIVNPHLLTTAVGQATVAVESIERYLQGEEVGRRPKVDVRHFDLLQKLHEGQLEPEAFEPGEVRGTDAANFAVHNYENRSFQEIIPADQLFLGHWDTVPRNRRSEIEIGTEAVLGHFSERISGLDEAAVKAEAERCMSCGMCFECDNCVVFCPQVAVKRSKRGESTMGRYVYTDYSRCIGCHICADVCPSGYIQMGLGE